MTSFFPATATGQRKATVPLTSYHSYMKHVTIHHGLELVGWPFPTVVSFPAIPHDVESLDILLSALQNNEWYFRRIAPETLMEIRKKYYESLLTQTVQSAQEQESTVTWTRPAFTAPIRKWIHLDVPAEGSSGSKRRRRD